MQFYLSFVLLIFSYQNLFGFQSTSIINDQLFNNLTSEISGLNAKKHVRIISNNHRVQATKGYLDAAKYVKAELDDIGISSINIHRYKSDGKTKYGTRTSPLSWTVKSATLDMIEPYELGISDYKKIATSLTTLSNGGEWT